MVKQTDRHARHDATAQVNKIPAGANMADRGNPSPPRAGGDESVSHVRLRRST